MENSFANSNKKNTSDSVILLIKNRYGAILQPITYEGIELSMKRKGSPETLTFKVQKDNLLNFHEGNPVMLQVGNKKMFVGYVFEKSRDKEGAIKVTAYSQLRYLKNKYSYQYTNKTAGEVIRMIASQYSLNYKNKGAVSAICDTEFVIEKRLEDNVTLFDMIQHALDDTLNATGKMYLLYDDCGVMTLKHIQDESLILDFGVDADTAENFEYTSSINKETYNRVVIIRDAEQGEHGAEKYTVEDTENIKKWGILQYFEKANEGDGNLQNKAEVMLNMYNRETRQLRIKGAFGDLRVRAGCTIFCNLHLGDMKLTSKMLVEEVTHKFNKDYHSMDLTLVGNIGFIA